MTATGKPEAGEKESQKILWVAGDWQKVEELAVKLTEETHVTVTPTEAVRVAVRRLYEQVCGNAA